MSVGVWINAFIKRIHLSFQPLFESNRINSTTGGGGGGGHFLNTWRNDDRHNTEWTNVVRPRLAAIVDRAINSKSVLEPSQGIRNVVIALTNTPPKHDDDFISRQDDRHHCPDAHCSRPFGHLRYLQECSSRSSYCSDALRSSAWTHFASGQFPFSTCGGGFPGGAVCHPTH